MTYPEGADVAAQDDKARLLDAVGRIHQQLRGPEAARVEITLDTQLDVELGLDSLTRVELVSRIEREFNARLHDRDMADAQTPRDLLRALQSARGKPLSESPAQLADDSGDMPREHRHAAPEDTPTLVDALLWHVREHGDRVHLHLYSEDGTVQTLSYAQLFEEAARIATGLVEQGLAPGESVAIMLPTGSAYLSSFLAILLAGGTPVPIYPPARVKQIEEHFIRHARILSNARARYLITFEQVRQVSKLLAARVPGLESVFTPQQLERREVLPAWPQLKAENIAFLQYTSGSTGDPKGVILTHANILASIRAMRSALDVGPDDVFVSWLPLYHDMGLIGAWLGALVVGFPLVLMSPLAFLARPERWLQAIHRHRGTISGGPNFSYDLCNRRIENHLLEGLDLSCWRLAFNGAEPVNPVTIERFSDRFSGWGFNPAAMTPVYGLAEATLGVTFTPRGRGPRIDHVSRDKLFERGVAVVDTSADAMPLVSSGVAINDFEVRVIDEAGHEAANRVAGEVQFKGPGVTSGYFRNSQATQHLFDGEWARSGDRGYVADGELYITGRDKDVIIRAGRNLYPYELEQAVGEVPGVRRGCVAVFGSEDHDNGTELVVVLAETRLTAAAELATIREQIAALSVEHLGLSADEIVLAPPQSVLKTSSGKIRRAALAQRYRQGRLVNASLAAPWIQVLRLAVGSLLPAVRRSTRRAAASLYAAWFALVFVLTVLWAWPCVVLLPALKTRWRVAHLAARSALTLAGISVIRHGDPPNCNQVGDQASRTGNVIVSNHQSYLDAIVLVSVFEHPVTFVGKRELASHAFSRLFLDALGVLYVDRFDRQQGINDARTIANAVRTGSRVLFFPEGTFHRMPGLFSFQLGAFEAAIDANAGVDALLIEGSRNVLRGDSMFARRHAVTVRFLPRIEATALARSNDNSESIWAAAVELRDRTRTAMLARFSEPDLATRNVLSELAARRQRNNSRQGDNQ